MDPVSSRLVWPHPDSKAAVRSDNGRTVLLVEDEQDVREMTADHLRDLGCRVLEAQDAAAALRLVQAGRIWTCL
ncbi:MAG: response regulator [Janthinobacterium lividum]